MIFWYIRLILGADNILVYQTHFVGPLKKGLLGKSYVAPLPGTFCYVGLILWTDIISPLNNWENQMLRLCPTYSGMRAHKISPQN